MSPPDPESQGSADLNAEFGPDPLIKVLGVGGGGSAAVEHMIARGVRGAEFICADTDAEALSRSSARWLIQLGASGLDADADPEVGKAAAKDAEQRIREAIVGANMLFITAGMGGGTGTGAAPVIARLARDMGILTVGVVTRPFGREGVRRAEVSDAGLAELEAHVDTLIAVRNDKLLEMPSIGLTSDCPFARVNEVLKNTVGGISEIVCVPGHVAVDFEDVMLVMRQPGKAMLGTACATGPDRATTAAEYAVACPLLEGVDLFGARGVLVLVAASRKTLKLSDSRDAMMTMRRYASEDACLIYGTACDESLGDQVRVTVIATGLSSLARSSKAPIGVVHSATAPTSWR